MKRQRTQEEQIKVDIDTYVGFLVFSAVGMSICALGGWLGIHRSGLLDGLLYGIAAWRIHYRNSRIWGIVGLADYGAGAILKLIGYFSSGSSMAFPVVVIPTYYAAKGVEALFRYHSMQKQRTAQPSTPQFEVSQ
jgi:hypothetical protein